MTTAESTISMVNQLTKPEMLSVQKYIKHLILLRKSNNPKLKKYTEDEFVQLIDDSIKQSQKGDVYSWADVRKEVSSKHAL